MNGTGASYASETVWNWGYVSSAGGYVGSSGGISSYYPIPAWQTNVNNLSSRGGSASFRNIPDVALTADNVFVEYGDGTSGEFGGTSCATALWAGFMALVNQQAAASRESSAGFVNPALYAIAAGTNYAACFHDITTGNNTWSSSPNLFYATSGYDLCTGLGTPAGPGLINALAPAVNQPLAVSPASGFAASGPISGAFNVTSQSYSLTNQGGISLPWSITNSSSWLSASPSSGTLAGHAQTTMTVSLTAAANSLAAGLYTAEVLVTDSAGVAASLQFTIAVGQPIVNNGGFETGDFTGWTLVGDSTIGKTIYNGVVSSSTFTGAANYIHSGNYGAVLGQSGSLGYLYQTLATSPGQNYLLSLWLDNPDNSYEATPNQFLVQWNGTTLFDQTNLPYAGWTNLQFIVTAPSASTTLQFGFEDTPYYLGLDDISVTLLSPPMFKTVQMAATAFQLTWGAVSGLAYQVQYSTNLLQTNWINLGEPLIASNASLTVSDTSAANSSPQRFYRLLELP
jgi:subtilase family serine protease